MRLLSTFVALALSASAAMAGDLGPLTPGHPAGVKSAQGIDNNLVWVAAGVGAAVFIGIVVAQGGHTTLPGQPVISNSTTGTAG